MYQKDMFLYNATPVLVENNLSLGALVPLYLFAPGE